MGNVKRFLVLAVVCLFAFLVTGCGVSGGTSAEGNSFKSTMESKGFTVTNYATNDEDVKEAYEAKNSEGTIIRYYVTNDKMASLSLHTGNVLDFATITAQRLFSDNQCGSTTSDTKEMMTCGEEYYVSSYNDTKIAYAYATKSSEKSTVDLALSSLGL